MKTMTMLWCCSLVSLWLLTPSIAIARAEVGGAEADREAGHEGNSSPTAEILASNMYSSISAIRDVHAKVIQFNLQDSTTRERDDVVSAVHQILEHESPDVIRKAFLNLETWYKDLDKTSKTIGETGIRDYRAALLFAECWEKGVDQTAVQIYDDTDLTPTLQVFADSASLSRLSLPSRTLYLEDPRRVRSKFPAFRYVLTESIANTFNGIQGASLHAWSEFAGPGVYLLHVFRHSPDPPMLTYELVEDKGFLPARIVRSPTDRTTTTLCLGFKQFASDLFLPRAFVIEHRLGNSNPSIRTLLFYDLRVNVGLKFPFRPTDLRNSANEVYESQTGGLTKIQPSP